MNKFDELVNNYTLMGDGGEVIFSSYDLFLEFIEEIRQMEREACAKVCDDWPNGRDDVYSLAVAIRARGNHD